MSDMAFADARTMTSRCLRLSLRNVDGLITALMLPVMMMVMFVYLFGGALSTGGKYVDYVVPGVLLVCVGFGAATTAVSVSSDLSSGIIDRFRSMDVRGDALIAGHVAASLLRNAASTAIVFGVAFAIGFRPHADAAQWFAAVAVLLLFVFALSWLAAAIGVAAHTPEAANGLTFVVSFMPYASSAFVPIRTMPGWLQAFARNQPTTPVVDAVRSLLRGNAAGAAPWHAAIWSAAIVLASVVLTGFLFRRRVS